MFCNRVTRHIILCTNISAKKSCIQISQFQFCLIIICFHLINLHINGGSMYPELVAAVADAELHFICIKKTCYAYEVDVRP
jgi:hypothetical protein